MCFLCIFWHFSLTTPSFFFFFFSYLFTLLHSYIPSISLSLFLSFFLAFFIFSFPQVVYYQRLRHMVSDKYQVRSTGPINAVTHQPIKGRKMGGGIRLGEMEKDSLIAHGVSAIIQDRLLHCSDEASVCAYILFLCLLSFLYSSIYFISFYFPGLHLHTLWLPRLCCNTPSHSQTLH